MCSTGASTLGKGRSLAGLTGFKGYPLGLFMTAGKGYSMLALQLGGVVHHSIPGLFLGVMGRTDYVTGNPVCGLGSTEKVHHVSISWHSIRSPKLIWWNIHLALSRIKVLRPVSGTVHSGGIWHRQAH